MSLARQYGITQAPPDPKVKPKLVVAEAAAKVSPATHLLTAASEAVSIAKGKTKPAKAGGTKKAAESNAVSNTQSNAAKFDKTAYQRDLMRKRRAAAKTKEA